MSPARQRISPQTPFRLGEWLVQPDVNELQNRGTTERIEPKAMQVLACLASRAGRVVTRDELLDAAWPDVVVTEGTLSRCISQLRRALDDDAREPRYIETIPKTGYRVIASVEYLGSDAATLTRIETVSLGERERTRDSASTDSIRRKRGWSSAIAAVILVFVSAVWLATNYAAENTTDPPRTLPLTAMPGTEHSASISPDGTRVLFIARDPSESRSGLFVKTISTDSPVRIGNKSMEAQHPCWSPDGLHIAYFACGDDGSCSLVHASALGTDERPILSGVERPWGLTWSPEGKEMVYSARDPETGSWRLFQVRIDSALSTPLTAPPAQFRGDVDPVYSPDGTTLVFKRSQSEGVAELLTISARGGNPEALTQDGASIAGQSWTPDGNEIVFSSTRNGLFQLWSIGLDGGKPRQLSEVAAHDPGFPQISPDGRTLVFEEWNIDVNLWELHPGMRDSTAVRRIGSTWWNRQPAISPDGKRVAFVSARSGKPEIWLSEIGGRNAFRVTESAGANVGTPSWAPDGKQIAFEAFRDGQSDIFVVAADGGQAVSITSSTGDDRTPSWSRDGKRIYFSSNRSGTWDIYSVTLRDDSLRQHTNSGGRRAIETMDGKRLLVARYGESGLWTVPLDGSAADRMPVSLSTIDWGNWDVGTNGVYWIQRDSAGIASLYSLANEQAARPTHLISVDNIVPDEPAIALSADGDLMLYARVERITSDLAYVRPFSTGHQEYPQ
ncbi:MAG: winged helix-turn-helix domain-containing protein [Rhodothermales bacterium]